jgi:REP element-mobilizing transposase RayT
MSNTYTQLYIQFVFAVQGRQNLISSSHRDELQKYITGIVQHRKHKMLAIYCMPDHTHILVGLNPASAISDLARDIKSISSGFINENNWIRGKFHWQEGFGAFSYSKIQLDTIIQYILNQEEHHKRTTFKDEYVSLLKQFAVEYDERFLFQWIEK